MTVAGQSPLWPATGRRPRGAFRALTLTAPWGWVMTRGPKRIENRDWLPTPDLLGGDWFCLHQGVGYEDEEGVQWIAERLGRLPPTREELLEAGELGALLAFARVLRVVTRPEEVFPEIDQERWLKRSPRNQGWWLDVRPLAAPITCRGFQKLWGVPAEAAAGLDAEYRRLGLGA